MTRTAAVHTSRTDSAEAGRDLGEQVVKSLGSEPPDAVVVFASSQFEYETLLTALDETCHPKIMVGSSSAGEFTGEQHGEGTACVLALQSTDIRIAAGLGRGVSDDRLGAAREAVSSFNGLDSHEFPHRTALVMTDALAGHADDLVEQLTVATSGKYQFAGGGAGDDARFARTHVFHGTKAFTNAVVALELLSASPLGIGVGHGWEPATPPFRVTETDGMTLVSLNGSPAVEAFEQHALATGQVLDRAAPLPFFLHNILGIATQSGHRLRVPLAITKNGAIACAAEIPTGARVHIMKTTAASAVNAAARATAAAVAKLRGAQPGSALVFDCVATRLRIGEAFGLELESVGQMLHGAPFVGCNTYGQIARADGQFGGFHNCTAVVMVLPA